jgi:hypothetical protein
MKNIEIGQKLIAFWGAMHPIEKLVVEELLYLDGKLDMVRAKDPEDEEIAYMFEVKNIRPDYHRKFHGVGVYAV